eukprot:CAMPEP_0179272980 /NCGR_PEP_ID=MMETSP0797-20121207/32778_1 /TAXON_ID=47934 /ORGANISM="Dinophysis acuminata, Strain DAEP01" /LENGTH=42 /DNA_ID= /DNA_START= /DNA_END= /DNA_ORIENTATION=
MMVPAAGVAAASCEEDHMLVLHRAQRDGEFGGFIRESAGIFS